MCPTAALLWQPLPPNNSSSGDDCGSMDGGRRKSGRAMAGRAAAVAARDRAVAAVAQLTSAKCSKLLIKRTMYIPAFHE